MRLLWVYGLILYQNLLLKGLLSFAKCKNKDSTTSQVVTDAFIGILMKRYSVVFMSTRWEVILPGFTYLTV